MWNGVHTRRRLQAAEQLSTLQQHFNELAQEVQQHAQRAKQCRAANATCIAYDAAAKQKVRHADVIKFAPVYVAIFI